MSNKHPIGKKLDCYPLMSCIVTGRVLAHPVRYWILIGGMEISTCPSSKMSFQPPSLRIVLAGGGNETLE